VTKKKNQSLSFFYNFAPELKKIMARILGIDYGLKRVGVAATDPLQIIAAPLDTIETPQILNFLKQYCLDEPVECIVIGEPKRLNGDDADILPAIRAFAEKLQKLVPDVLIAWQDERYTSFEAKQVMLKAGFKKKQRQDKSLTDKISAAIILQAYIGKQ
jgi:putative holliday junction resolvase